MSWSARAERNVAPAAAALDLAVALAPESPVTRVDQAAFAARALAARLHARLREAGLAMLRLNVIADFSTGERLQRTWRTREALSEQGTADRVRWQLDGWLTGRGEKPGGVGDAAGGAGLVELTLVPLEVEVPRQDAQLWGNSRTGQDARRAVERLVSQLGADHVRQPQLQGGRGVAERVVDVPFGEVGPSPRAGSWPGKIPGPLPARLGPGKNHPASQIHIVAADGAAVTVTAEAELSAVPAAVSWGKKRYWVTGWAGPWPVARPRPVARLQLVAVEEGARCTRAWLVAWHGGRWSIEALYA